MHIFHFFTKQWFSIILRFVTFVFKNRKSKIVIAQWFPRKNTAAGVHHPYKSIIMFIPYYNRQASILFHNIIFMDQEFCNFVIYFT